MRFEVLNNDFAMDVKNSYIAKLKQGKNDSTSLEEVLNEYAEEQTDEDLRLTFWMSLAMVMWEYGRLTEEVKNKTNTELELGLDLILDDEKKDYLEIKEQYNSTMSERKKVSVHKPYRTGWNVGDIYSFQIQDSIKGYEKYVGWYAIIYINKLFLKDWYVDGVEDEIAEAYFFLSAEEPVDEKAIDVSKNVCFFMWKKRKSI